MVPVGPEHMRMGKLSKKGLMGLDVWIEDGIHATMGTCIGDMLGHFDAPYSAGRGAQAKQFKETMAAWGEGGEAAVLLGTPPIHHYIRSEYVEFQRSGGPPKSQPYGSKFPTMLKQWGNLEAAVHHMAEVPEDLVEGTYPGSTAGQGVVYGKWIPSSVAGGTATWAIRLKLGEYFGTYARLLGPSGMNVRGMGGTSRKGVGYVWYNEFGWGVPQRSFIIPALKQAAEDWDLKWSVKLLVMEEIMENSKKYKIPRLTYSTTVSPGGRLGIPTKGVIEDIKAIPQRHSGIFQLLLWLMPVNEYLSIFAALKDIKAFISGKRLSANSVRAWLESMVLGSTGLTVKSQRKSFRKSLWGG